MGDPQPGLSESKIRERPVNAAKPCRVSLRSTGSYGCVAPVTSERSGRMEPFTRSFVPAIHVFRLGDRKKARGCHAASAGRSWRGASMSSGRA